MLEVNQARDAALPATNTMLEDIDQAEFNQDVLCCYPGCSSCPSPEKVHWAKIHPCNECGAASVDIKQLRTHAATTSHRSFNCVLDTCNSTFTRDDSLRRHVLSKHLEMQRFPCTMCQKYTGQAAFKRKDHLTQHLRNCHEVEYQSNLKTCTSCPHQDCNSYREGAFDSSGKRITGGFMMPELHAFARARDFHDHMRTVHNETPFSCRAPGCNRRNGKGFFRTRDLEDHQRNEHAEIADRLKRNREQWLKKVEPYFAQFVGWS